MLVYLEGIGGSGKTELAKQLEEALAEQNYDVILTKEPGGGQAFGLVVREMILQGTLAPLTDLLLFMADRSEHRATIIRPALNQGKIVICDRGPASTIAYQVGLQKMPGYWVDDLSRIIDEASPMPQAITIWLDCPVDIALKRLSSRNNQLDKFDQEVEQQRISDSYDRQFDSDQGWRRIDATQSSQKVLSEALAICIANAVLKKVEVNTSPILQGT